MAAGAEEGRGGKLNASQQRHLLASCQHADKLLAEIEAVLTASRSHSPFPKFQPDLSAAQAKAVQDYISRIRAQVVRVLEGQGVEIPAPRIGSLHSIRVTLGFIDIAFEECRPQRMAGYGEIAEGARTALAGLVDELQGIVSRLNAYLARPDADGWEERLRRLERAGADAGPLTAIAEAIERHGLVEFLPALETAIQRMESTHFEIAVFGRVSCGKSSLLNHIVGESVLPVGVNPITAVPTRLAYGAQRRATAWFADRPPEQFGIERLAEFVTEQRNPANMLHVTRVVAELPAARLREGVVLVDTPGLGSLATSGAAETKAYLPKCDLGVVLIDAGSTLTADDLAAIQALDDAGIPVMPLLSKADALDRGDGARVRDYVAEHIRCELGLDLAVHAVSVKPGHTDALEEWLNTQIIPLYGRHAELARQSLERKTGALRLGVEAAVEARLRRRPMAKQIPEEELRRLDAALRTASGKIAEARIECIAISDGLRNLAGDAIAAAATAIANAWAEDRARVNGALVRAKLEQAAAAPAARIALLIEAAALDAGRALAAGAETLGLASAPQPGELLEVIHEMPRFDPGGLEIAAAPGWAASLVGREWAARSVRRRLRSQAGEHIELAAATYSRVAQAWVRETFAAFEQRFDSYADAYRAQLDRLLENGAVSGGAAVAAAGPGD